MNPNEIKMKNCFIGTMLGCAIGDATGFSVERKSPLECQNYLKEVAEGNFIQYRQPFNIMQISDDTQQTIQLAESLIACNGFNPEDYAARLVDSFKNGKMVGAGSATKSACKNMLQGMPWNEAGAEPPMAGNGAAMRVGAMALWYNDSPLDIMLKAKEQALITHKDQRSGDGAAIVAIAIYRLLYLASGFDAFKFMDFITEHTEQFIGDEAKHALHILNKLIRKNPEWELEKAADYISFNLDVEYSQKKTHWNIISPYVLSTVMWALYSFIKNAESFNDTMNYAIGCGGDVDTTSSIAGSLCGAYLGRNNLPKKQIFLLNDYGKKQLDIIMDLSVDIFNKRFTQ